MTPHGSIRTSTLLLAALLTTVVAWLGLRWLAPGGHVPSPGWVGLVAMLFLGGGLLVAGWQVRKVRDGSGDGRLTPLRAARTLVLGQAAALTGAVLVGWYAANLLVLLPDSDVESQRTRAALFAVHALVAGGLSAAGMVVQWWCRIRPRDEDDETAT